MLCLVVERTTLDERIDAFSALLRSDPDGGRLSSFTGMSVGLSQRAASALRGLPRGSPRSRAPAITDERRQ
jgi:hypothetical protein